MMPYRATGRTLFRHVRGRERRGPWFAPASVGRTRWCRTRRRVPLPARPGCGRDTSACNRSAACSGVEFVSSSGCRGTGSRSAGPPRSRANQKRTAASPPPALPPVIATRADRRPGVGLVVQPHGAGKQSSSPARDGCSGASRYSPTPPTDTELLREARDHRARCRCCRRRTRHRGCTGSRDGVVARTWRIHADGDAGSREGPGSAIVDVEIRQIESIDIIASWRQWFLGLPALVGRRVTDRAANSPASAARTRRRVCQEAGHRVIVGRDDVVALRRRHFEDFGCYTLAGAPASTRDLITDVRRRGVGSDMLHTSGST